MKHETFHAIPVRPISANGAAPTFYTRIGKRVLDVVLAIVLGILLLPIIAVLFFVARSDGGPAFFAHKRVGQNGKPFYCLKMRTMVLNAEEKLGEYLKNNPEAAAEWAKTQKLADDPRITEVGRFLRKTSLDELPQIWNVLKGDMSFVGPRPIVEAELEHYGPLADMYLSMKPGVTGHWQVFGRENGCYTERRNMDRAYSRQMSIAKDLELIARTATVIVRPTGR